MVKGLDEMSKTIGPAHMAPPLTRLPVVAGFLGRKVGKGFYDYGKMAGWPEGQGVKNGFRTY